MLRELASIDIIKMADSLFMSGERLKLVNLGILKCHGFLLSISPGPAKNDKITDYSEIHLVKSGQKLEDFLAVLATAHYERGEGLLHVLVVVIV